MYSYDTQGRSFQRSMDQRMTHSMYKAWSLAHVGLRRTLALIDKSLMHRTTYPFRKIL